MQTTLSSSSLVSAGLVAAAAGVIQLVGVVFLILFFTVGGPFGTLNDICIGLAGVLSVVLAWQLLTVLPTPTPALGWLAVVAATVGGLIAVAGSVLVISNTTGWVLAGFYNEFGFALVGLWVLVLCALPQAGTVWPGGLRTLGFIAGAVMLLGLLTLSGLLRGIDNWDAIPWYVNAGQAGALGWLILFPIWCLWLSRVLPGRA